jgi:hypothetical protein
MIFLAGTFMMIWQKQQNGWLVAAVFLVVTLVCASWKMWYFGCSFGQRSFIEYYALMAVPFGYFMTWVFSKRSIVVQTVLLFVVFVLVYFNLRYTVALYQYERCYYGSTWDWDHYFRSVERAGVISPVRQVQSFENDFENLALSPVFRPSKIFTRSGLYSVAANDKSGITPLFSIRLDEFRYPYPKRMEVELWALKPGSSHTGASLEYTLSRGQEILFRDGQPLDSVLKSSQTWSKVVKTFIIPDVFDSSLLVRMFLRNPGKAMVFVDDLRIRYRYGWR